MSYTANVFPTLLHVAQKKALHVSPFSKFHGDFRLTWRWLSRDKNLWYCWRELIHSIAIACGSCVGQGWSKTWEHPTPNLYDSLWAQNNNYCRKRETSSQSPQYTSINMVPWTYVLCSAQKRSKNPKLAYKEQKQHKRSSTWYDNDRKPAAICQ